MARRRIKTNAQSQIKQSLEWKGKDLYKVQLKKERAQIKTRRSEVLA